MENKISLEDFERCRCFSTRSTTLGNKEGKIVWICNTCKGYVKLTKKELKENAKGRLS